MSVGGLINSVLVRKNHSFEWFSPEKPPSFARWFFGKTTRTSGFFRLKQRGPTFKKLESDYPITFSSFRGNSIIFSSVDMDKT